MLVGTAIQPKTIELHLSEHLEMILHFLLFLLKPLSPPYFLNSHEKILFL